MKEASLTGSSESWRRAERNECSYLCHLTEVVETDTALFFFNNKAKVPMVNHVAHVRTTEKEALNIVDKAVDFYRGKVPFTCFHISPLTRPEGMASTLASLSFQPKAKRSVLQYEFNRRRITVNPEVKTRKVGGADFDTWFSLFFTIFGFARETFEGLEKAYRSLLNDSGATFYLGLVNEHPVGTTTLFSEDGVGGIYNVATHPHMRKKGIATSLISRALNDSVEVGNDLHCLQAMRGSQGERLDFKLGFRTMFYDQLFILPRLGRR